MTIRTVCIAALLAATVSCGDSPSSPGSGDEGIGGTGTTGTLTAVVDGAPFSSTQVVTATYSTVGNFLVVAGGNGTLALSFSALGGVGSSSVGSQVQTTGNLGTLSGPAWAADSIVGGTGSVTISTLTATTATGTFNFTMVPRAGTGASGNRSVTNGRFNVRFN